MVRFVIISLGFTVKDRSNKERDSQDLNIILTQLRYNCLFVLLVKYSLTFAKFPLPTYYYHYYESLLILVEVQ